MPTAALRNEALQTIDGYLHVKAGSAVAPVPYFNNKTVKARFSVRALIGKGSPDDIRDEVRSFIVKHHIDDAAIADESLSKLMVDHGVGVDCSAFAYHVLDAESRARRQGALNKHLTFIARKGPMAKMAAYLRPVENCDVSTFASDMNSRAIPLAEAQPGDIVTMTSDTGGPDRNHILVIREVGSEDGAAKRLRYSHSIAYPEDGVYGTGVRQGEIEITDPSKPITEQLWTEGGAVNAANRLYLRAKSSKTELRRLKWF